MNYVPGCGRESKKYTSIASGNLFHYDKDQKIPGLQATYFNNITLEGTPALTRTDPNIDFRWTSFFS